MRGFKILLFPIITVLFYITLIEVVFFGSASITDIGTTISLEFLLLIFLFLSLLPLNQKTTLQLAGIFSIISGIIICISYLVLPLPSTIFLLGTHVTIISFIIIRYFYRKRTKIRYSRATAHEGFGVIAILLSLTYTATLWTAGGTINLQCTNLYEQSMGFLTKFMPSLQHSESLSNFADGISNFGSKNIGELLGVSEENTLLGWYPQVDNGSGSHSLLGSFILYQESLLNNLVENQTLINEQVCEVTLSHITNIANNNNIQLVVFILLTLLLYVFMNTIMFIVSIINFIFFVILLKIGRFKKINTQDQIEDISL